MRLTYNEAIPQYKIAYIAYFVINVILVVSILIIQWLDISFIKTIEWLDSWVTFWGITMVLFLMSKSFIVSSSYKGSKVLDGFRTRVFALTLFMISIMGVCTSLFEQYLLLVMTSISMIIWIITFIWSLIRGQKFIIDNIHI